MKRRSLAQWVAALSWPAILAYGTLLAAGVLLMQWIEYPHLTQSQPGSLRIALLAALFIGVGVWIGSQLFRTGKTRRAEGNPQAQAALGISEREKQVLDLLAAGQSNKEIARTLGVSPNTVKTHVSRLFEKLEVQRRTQAISRARELGLVR